MNSDSTKPVLIAVSITKIERVPIIDSNGIQLRSVYFRAQSTVQEACFDRYSGPLHPDLMSNCEKLQRHGFTVVEAPDNWKYGYFPIAGGWQSMVLQKAIERVKALPDYSMEQGEMANYDSELADRVLEATAKTFPRQINMAELKHELEPEPSDEALLIALDALHIDKFIEGPQVRSGYRNELRDMMLIRITNEGRRHLAAKSEQIAAQNSVFHGDQIINYGQVAAIGRNASGAINFYQQQWQQIENSVDLETLVTQLEQLRQELQRNATSRDDFKQLGLIAEAEEYAEKHDGGKVLEALSKTGRALFQLAEKIGAEVAAKVILKSLKIE